MGRSLPDISGKSALPPVLVAGRGNDQEGFENPS
jgi:hypothetical protein